MNDEIKSAYEIAMEKLAAIEAPTNAERYTWKYVPEGERLAHAAAVLGPGLQRFDDD